MLYAVLFTDNDALADVRPRLMPQHLAFLQEHRDQVRAAGPLSDRDGKGAGGLWLVDADDADAVMALVQADPFWPTGLRKEVRVLKWTQVFTQT
ncbi:MAG TPA: YciI family protein [Reyranella sp.]|nr:YciI family protein [Reyranella sp.]